MIWPVLVELKQIFELGRSYPWPRPECCPRCSSWRVWGHGYAARYFDGFGQSAPTGSGAPDQPLDIGTPGGFRCAIVAGNDSGGQGQLNREGHCTETTPVKLAGDPSFLLI